MLNESSNDPDYWKDKLQELDNLPGETWNKTAAWGRLQQRLIEKSAGKKTAWYWAAAACLLLTFFITRLSHISKEVTLVKNNIPKKPITLPGTQVPFTDSRSVISRQNPAEREQSIADKVKNKKKDAIPNNYAIIDDPAITTTEVITDLTPQYVDSNNAGTIALAGIPIKKKLRVVHINELGKPMEESNQYVQNNATNVFKTNSLTKNVFSRFVISTNSSDNILKIKLSPSN